MAVAFVAEADALVASGSLTVNVPTGTADGDCMLAVVLVGTGSAAITPPSGWTLLTTGTSGPSMFVYQRIASSEPASYTWTVGTGAAGIIATYSDVDSISPVDVTGMVTRTTSSTGMTALSVTTSDDGDYIVFLGGFGNSEASYTGPTGYTQRGAPSRSNASAILADAPQSSHGATGDVTATGASSGNNYAVLVALTPASGGSAPVNTVGAIPI